MQRLVFLLLGTFCSLIASAQILRGNIVSSNGEPIPYATIYIHETTTGIIADEKGAFQVKVQPSTYTCEMRSIGFETQTKTVEVSTAGATIRVILPDKIQNLN